MQNDWRLYTAMFNGMTTVYCAQALGLQQGNGPLAAMHNHHGDSGLVSTMGSGLVWGILVHVLQLDQ